MSDDTEIEAIRTAYAPIKGMSRNHWTRALEYLARRMAEDDRSSYIGFRWGVAFPPPVQYVRAGEIFDPYASQEEVVTEAGYDDLIVEVNGIATVSQSFAVCIPIEDDTIIKWFETRDAAEAYLAQARTL